MELQEARKIIRDNSNPIGDVKFASSRWDLNQERMFVENLVGQRLNFMLVFVGLILTASVNMRETPALSALILSFGTMIVYFLRLAIRRANDKLDIFIDLIRLDPEHPVTISYALARSESRRAEIGKRVPTLSFAGLLVATLIAWLVAAMSLRDGRVCDMLANWPAPVY